MYSLLKQLYHSSIRLKKRLRNLVSPTARIILYHRVANTNTDPHQLCVSPENFREQIKYLKENFRIVPLVKLIQEIRVKKLKNNTLAITFDDGYADNLYNALPVLQEYNVPATIFLTAGYMGQNKPFYWDPPNRQADANAPSENQGRPMALDEVKMLSKARIIEIGGHTVNHPKLTEISKDETFKEIADGKRMIEEMIGFPILSFAYPFGDKNSFNKTTIELVRKAGFHYACTNIHERTTNRSDIYTLPRFIVRNWNAFELEREMRKWL